jgi:hypothetical protein
MTPEGKAAEPAELNKDGCLKLEALIISTAFGLERARR